MEGHAKPVLLSPPLQAQQREQAAAEEQEVARAAAKPPGRPVSSPGRLPGSRISSILDALSPRTVSPQERGAPPHSAGRLSRGSSRAARAAGQPEGSELAVMSPGMSLSRPSPNRSRRRSSAPGSACDEDGQIQIPAVAEVRCTRLPSACGHASPACKTVVRHMACFEKRWLALRCRPSRTTSRRSSRSSGCRGSDA